MSAPARPDELMALADIAALCGVSSPAVANWRKRPASGFPAPWGEWANGALWRRADIEGWQASRQAARLERLERRRARLVQELERLADAL